MVQLASYYLAFLIAACVMLNKRLTTPNSQLPWGPFRLGRLGVPITIMSIVYTLVGLIFPFWPTDKDITAADMNYTILVFGAAIIFTVLCWLVYGRKSYKGPVWEFESEIKTW